MVILHHNVKFFKKEEMKQTDGHLDVIDHAYSTNIHDFTRGKRIRGQQKDVSRFVVALHPLNDKSFQVAISFGRRGVDTTTVAMSVGRFFARSRYEPIVPSGAIVTQDGNFSNTTSNTNVNVNTNMISSVINVASVLFCFSFSLKTLLSHCCLLCLLYVYLF